MRRVVVFIVCAMACEEPREATGPSPFGQGSTSEGTDGSGMVTTTGISATSEPQSESGAVTTNAFTTGPEPSSGGSTSEPGTGTGTGTDSSTGSTTGTETGTSSSSEDTGIGKCGEVEVGMGMCPAACSDCTDGICTITCDGDNACSGFDLDCPNDWPCVITCDGTNACANAVITCANSTCELQCAAESCLNADMQCAEEACTAACEAGASLEVFDCEACSCDSTC